MKNLKFLTALFVILFISKAFVGQNERGILPIYNYSPKEYEAQPQNWDAIQNKNGILYFGNNIGLLEFKGANSKNEKWKLHKVTNGSNVRTIDIDKKGYIYVGASEEFGYFAPDSNFVGDLNYYSLASKLDTSFNSYEVWHVVATDSAIYYATNNDLIIYKNNEIEIIYLKRIKALFKINNQVFLAEDSLGLVEIKGNKTFKINISDYFINFNSKNNKYCDIKSLAKIDDNSFFVYSNKFDSRLLKVTKERGNYKVTPFKTNVDEALQNTPINSISFAKNKLIISTQYFGIIIINDKGKLENIINKNLGLQNNRIRNTYLDDQNYLWATLNDGISRIKLFSNYSRFPQLTSQFDGKIEGITRFNEQLYICGSNGLYKLDKNISNISEETFDVEAIKDFNFSNFTKVFNPDILPEGANVWALQVVKTAKKEVLLLSTDNDVIELDKKGNLTKVIGVGPWCFHIDKNDSARVFLGLYQRGIGSIYLDDDEWITEGRIGDININVRNIDQDNNGNIWMGTDKGIIKLNSPKFEENKIVNPEITYYYDSKGLPENDAVYCRYFNNNIIVGTGNGVYKYDSKSDSFLLFTDLGKWFSKTHHIFRIAIDEYKKMWSVIYSEDDKYIYLARTSLTSEKEYITNRLVVDEGERILSIFPEEDGTVWLGGDNGLFRLKNSNDNFEDIPFRTYLNYVISSEDTIFKGIFYDENGYIINEQSDVLKPTVSYDKNDFLFVISSIGYNNEVPLRYSFYLEGDEDHWTNWSFSNSRRYSNLHEGNYILHLKSMDIFGNISDVTTYEFTVKPPWYRTILAYVLYILFFAGFVWAAITISTRSLRKIIREATAEIQKQKDDIEEKNKNIMDSIKYAQRIQEAVLPSDAKLKKYFPEHFVLFKPRDIVSGDFYWMMNKGKKNIIIAADCTGHGVPGAFMSIMGVSFLNEITNKKEVQTAAEVLNQLRANIINSLNTDDDEENTSKDGMDISVCVYDMEEMTMQFAGAYNPLYMIRNGEFSKVKADRMPVGVHERDDKAFTNNVFEIKQDDRFYILSDGIIDQFGGPKGKKFMTKRFEKLLLDIYQKPMEEQRQLIDDEHLKWRGEIEQVDDIIVIGIRVV